MSGSEAAAARQVLDTLRARAFRVWPTRRPWSSGWGGLDALAIEERLGRALRGGVWLARDVFMDDGLALAACHALLGQAPSATATLASRKTPEAFAAARAALRRALACGAFPPGEPALVPASPGRELTSLLERLRHTPDPVAFGSPEWRDPGLRPHLLSRLQQRGPHGLARAYRELLGAPFADLDRFWLAGRERVTTRQLVALAAWLRPAEPAPSERDWILFLEKECRRLNG
jgi:hypothetical protein